jgi:hypothetical protein
LLSDGAPGESLEVHPLMVKPSPVRPLEFDLPAGAIRNGELTLAWYGEPGLGGNGRGCQVSEVWLVRPGRDMPRSYSIR